MRPVSLLEWETQSTPSQTFTVLRVLLCENLIVYCVDRIRCFPGKGHSQEAKHFVWADRVHAGNETPRGESLPCYRP